MRPIILASKSAARRALLKEAGIKFKVFESNVEEKLSGYKSYACMVADNALHKARHAAPFFPQGLIIGADTVICLKNKIIGKPADISQAVKLLKFLSRNPHWVYTGLALLDIDKNKEFTCFEKTRVLMEPLSAKQIKGYFSRFSPLDKAGGFDIRGTGAFFIRRIEGCFYNVVGLPMAKLYGLFRKAGVDFFKENSS